MVKNNFNVSITSIELASNCPLQYGQRFGFGRRNSALRQDEHTYTVTYACDTLFPMLMPIEPKRNTNDRSFELVEKILIRIRTNFNTKYQSIVVDQQE